MCRLWQVHLPLFPTQAEGGTRRSDDGGMNSDSTKCLPGVQRVPTAFQHAPKLLATRQLNGRVQRPDSRAFGVQIHPYGHSKTGIISLFPETDLDDKHITPCRITSSSHMEYRKLLSCSREPLIFKCTPSFPANSSQFIRLLGSQPPIYPARHSFFVPND